MNCELTWLMFPNIIRPRDANDEILLREVLEEGASFSHNFLQGRSWLAKHEYIEVFKKGSKMVVHIFTLAVSQNQNSSLLCSREWVSWDWRD